jgi:hypothetical protein
MKSKIGQYIENLCSEKGADNLHCDITSSKIQMVNVPIPANLFQELEIISSEYKRDINCLAGDFLTLALEEVIEHIPSEEKTHLDEIKRARELKHTEMLKTQCVFDAGGT